jgi:hypothetical protein
MPDRKSVFFGGLHAIAILIGVAGIVWMGRLIPGGAEGGWLTRVYVGAMLGAAVLANAVFLVLGFFRKGSASSVSCAGLVACAIAPAIVLWYLVRAA